jgi:hypothetical protein
MKDVQATGEAFSHHKRTYSTSKKEIYKLFSIFVGHFCPPGSGFESGYRSRHPIEFGEFGSNPSKSTTLWATARQSDCGKWGQINNNCYQNIDTRISVSQISHLATVETGLALFEMTP